MKHSILTILLLSAPALAYAETNVFFDTTTLVGVSSGKIDAEAYVQRKPSLFYVVVKDSHQAVVSPQEWKYNANTNTIQQLSAQELKNAEERITEEKFRKKLFMLIIQRLCFEEMSKGTTQYNSELQEINNKINLLKQEGK